MCPSVLQSLTGIGATSRPCGAKNLIFWPVSKNNTGSLPLRGILPVTSSRPIWIRDTIRKRIRSIQDVQEQLDNR